MRQRLVATLSSLLLALGALAVLQVAGAPAASAATQIIAIPTSASGAGRIVASPDGSLWFVERDANKVGKVNPDATISEFAFPAGASGVLEDLDVAPDGSVWVVYDTGRRIRHMTAAGVTISDQSLGSYPYGQQVRVAPGGYVVITMSFDEQFVSLADDTQVVDLANSPECPDALGRGADGSMWCRTSSGLTRLTLAPGGGGTTYPVNDFAAYPYAIAAGPVGSIWFGRYQDGTFFTPDSDGAVGFLDAGSGAVTAYDTGERTAPSSLIQGPDGNMWFTSTGAAKGIGHLAPNGSGGALTAIGNYAPTSIAFGRDGAVYATDSANNVVIKTTIADLQVTNVDPGAGSVLYGAQPGSLKAGKKPITVRKNRVPLKITCPAGAAQGCQGTLRLLTNAEKKPQVVAKAATYEVAAGKKGKVTLKLTKKGLKKIKRGKATRLRVELSVPGGTAPVAVTTIKVRR